MVFATGSVVIDSKLHGALGIPFIAFAPFIGIAIGVYIFGRVSMAHFNPAVSLGFLITKHIRKPQLLYYIIAEIIGAFLGSLFVKFLIGSNANLGANAPNYYYPIPYLLFERSCLTVGTRAKQIKVIKQKINCYLRVELEA